MEANPHLITAKELADRLGSPDLPIVDASWHLPAQGRDAKAEFAAAHVPGAVFFDHDAVVDPGSTLPHALPSPEGFAAAAGALGVAETDKIVVYDGLGLFSAPRAWWLFRTFGARRVRLLDGGFPAWRAAGLPTESGSAHPLPKTFHPTFDADAVVTLAEMRQHVETGDVAVADARSAERFEGSAPEPRAGVRSGHIPGARSLPFTVLGREGRLKTPAELRAEFERAGIDPAAPVVTSCGSGITAAVINFALASLGNTEARLYDGSWTEWGSAADTPVETGGARQVAAKP
ncbi:3-mercaptopyruvate sulfurtransferase [Aureimonas leprariae]|uniref:Sulfurtransferase n=2 Tax=Plantimonas leprariae TaxID=2615207 RepID=A0A7V7PSD2_9HYPH|nr:3-mercaptopyruvate sulfurtransferase [Aureimonas leprariae]KAB0682038.1 3-mercaptopyruvate sulfurtransferase [Aureimonas leprariae]